MRRTVLLLLFLVGAGALSCEAPTEPSAAERRYAELRSAPAWAVSAARDSVFSQQIRGYRELSDFFAGGWHVARTPEHWSTLWDTVAANYLPVPPVPAVDFGEEMVVMGAFGVTSAGYTIEIVHVTRQRDTTFVLVRTVAPGRDCATPGAGVSPVDARVVPLAPPPTWFLVEPMAFDCRAFRLVPMW